MTDAQHDALRQVQGFLKEHFEGSLVAVITSPEGSDDKDETKVMWHGGHILARGLALEAADWVKAGGNPDRGTDA